MKIKAERGISDDLDLNAEDMKKLVELFKAFYKNELKSEFPEDPKNN